MPQGNFGRVQAWNDFTSSPLSAADNVPLALTNNAGGGWQLHGVNEGTAIFIADEPNGVIQLTSDTGDNDNTFLSAGTWAPENGGMEMEVRFKVVDSYAATRAAVWVGFTETLAIDTPVMPYEVITATQTYNGTGGMVGFAFDSDGTTDAAIPAPSRNTNGLHFHFIAGDGGASLALVTPNGVVPTNAQEGINAEVNEGADTMTVNEWIVFRVEIGADGLARGYIGDQADDEKQAQRLVGTSTGALGLSDNFHAAVGLENRSGANEIIEIDYAYARGWRDYRK